jgi:hypothetical protein
MIEMIEHRENARKKIVYASVARLSDRLREEFPIPDRRPQLSSTTFRMKTCFRFPARDTMSAQKALSILGFQIHPVPAEDHRGREVRSLSPSFGFPHP